MANQVIVTNTGNVQVALTPPANVQVQISRAAIGTVSNVPTANFANYAGNVTASNQPNITNVGTLGNLNVSGTGTFGNVIVTGNLQVGNLVANNANYSNFAGIAFNVSGSNVTGAVANANYAANAGNATIANSANSVTLANVSGAGNIASINLDGNASNILFGNGTFSAIPVVSNVANANYANFSGTAFSVSGSNVSGEVANAAYANAANTANLATYATTANAVAGANVSGTVANANYSAYANIAATANSVAVANVSGIGNIAVINLDGNASNVLFGNGVFGPESGNLNANYANFAGEAFNVNASNITGTVANANYSAYAGEANTANLATFATTANAVAGANVSGTVANATFALDAGNANLANLATYATTANSVAGANVSGEVANANFASYANLASTANLATFATTANSVAGANVSGEVANANFASYSNIASSANSVALANVVGIGNIANINLDGNASNILFGNGTFSAIPVVSNVANANYANFAGTAFSVSGSNVSGEVANANFASYANLASTANLATFATTANAVAGANVSGEVANANYASYANIANTANSVALANVVGIGNIANINLDGSSSNVLFGNGVFAPESTSIANANYANFAGNVINGTSNISIPTASSNILISTAGNANIVDIWAQGTVNLKPPPQGPLNALRIETYGRSGNTGAQRISSFRFRGNSTTPLGVFPGDYTMELITAGSNGTALQTNSVAFVRGQVDNSYTANSANIPLGWQVTVNDTNGGINNQGKTHNFYANGNVTFANSVFVTDSLSVTGNVTGNYIIGNGSSLSSLTGGNVTGQVANALVAGTVYTNAQPNITSTGNLISLNVVDSANVTGTIQQLAPNTITITTNANNNTAYDLTTIYGQTSNIQESGQRAIIRSRGNVSTPATVAVNDVGSRDRVYFYNGTTNAIGFTSSVILSNLNSNSNAYSTGTNYNISTGNPNGDQGNVNASSALNTLSFRDTGQLILLPGANSTSGSMLNMINYGLSTSLSTAQGLTMSRARGNRDANLSVEANDQIGRVVFQAHNGTSFVTNRLPIIRATVDANYTPNTANVPAGFQFLVNDNTTSYTHNFYANGNVQFSNSATFGSLTQDTTVEIKGNNGNGYLRLNGVAFNVIQDNANGAAGYSPFFFTTYQSNNDYIPASKFYRVKGTSASPGAVDANSMVSLNQYAVYADSGNTYKRVFEEIITVTGNDGVGNVTANLDILTFNTGSNINLQANTYANNVSISSGGFMKLASYTAAGLTAVTGQIGWMAAVSNSSGGGNPNGMIAFWDTTHSRWSYIHDNSAV